MADLDRPTAVKAKRQRRRVQAPSDEVRNRILEAAAELIAVSGFPELRMDELAKRAGLSVGALYLYFEGKNDLFVELVTGYTDRLIREFHRADDAGGAVVDRLARRFDAYLDFVEDNRSGFLYFRDSGTVNTTGGRLSAWALNVHAADLRPLLEEGMASGELRPLDPGLLAHAVTGLLQHMVGVWLESDGALSRDELRHFLDSLIAFGTQSPGSVADE
jgi:AcrR family transcriptional regulator